MQKEARRIENLKQTNKNLSPVEKIKEFNISDNKMPKKLWGM